MTTATKTFEYKERKVTVRLGSFYDEAYVDYRSMGCVPFYACKAGLHLNFKSHVQSLIDWDEQQNPESGK